MSLPSAEPRARHALVSRGLTVSNVLATGALLGILQWCTLFLLQSYVASTAIVYLLSTTVWLVGSLAGMVLPGRPEALWLGAALGSFYALRALATAHPYDMSYLPILLVFVFAMGAYAGNFFRRRAHTFERTKWLFFLENTGFVGGILGTSIALYVSGDRFFLFGPAVATAVVVATGARVLLRR